MKTIAKSLGLSEDATESDITAAIAAKTSNLSGLKLSLGLPETATDKDVTKAAEKLNLEVKDGKLVNKVVNTDNDDDDDMENVSNTADVMKHVKMLKKAHADLKDCYNDLSTRCDAMEDTIGKFKKAAIDNKVGDKIIAIVSAGKVENKEESIKAATALLNADFENASKVYDAIPAKKVDLKTPGAINDLITKAAKEHGVNVSTVADEVADKTVDMFGKEIDLSKTKKPTVKDALNELNGKSTKASSAEEVVNLLMEKLKA